MDAIELLKDEVKIYRDTEGRIPISEVKRDIPNKKDVVIKRRPGEGSKPIFDREEIKREEVEAQRIVVSVNLENSENMLKSLKRRSASLSPTRTRNHSPKHTRSRHRRFEASIGTTLLFKRSEAIKMDPIELRRNKVKVYRYIRGRIPTSEVKRDIPNKKDVVIKRRPGEGSKPIFDREEIKRGIDVTEEVQEQLTVVTVNLENTYNTVLHFRVEASSGIMFLFKASEATKIDPIELHRIKVKINRHIKGRIPTSEVKLDIPNKENVVIKSRPGEGSKPIFDREEIKRGVGETENVEEQRIVRTVNLDNSENTLKSLRRNSASFSPTRNRNHSPRRTWSRHRRYDDSKHEGKESYRSDREKDHSRERSRDDSRDRRQTDRSTERDWPREQGVRHYIEPIPIPIPIYYGNFPPRPLMRPSGTIQGPPAGNIRPRMMGPFGSFRHHQ